MVPRDHSAASVDPRHPVEASSGVSSSSVFWQDHAGSVPSVWPPGAGGAVLFPTFCALAPLGVHARFSSAASTRLRPSYWVEETPVPTSGCTDNSCQGTWGPPEGSWSGCGTWKPVPQPRPRRGGLGPWSRPARSYLTPFHVLHVHGVLHAFAFLLLVLLLLAAALLADAEAAGEKQEAGDHGNGDQRPGRYWPWRSRVSRAQPAPRPAARGHGHGAAREPRLLPGACSALPSAPTGRGQRPRPRRRSSGATPSRRPRALAAPHTPRQHLPRGGAHPRPPPAPEQPLPGPGKVMVGGASVSQTKVTRREIFSRAVSRGFPPSSGFKRRVSGCWQRPFPPGRLGRPPSPGTRSRPGPGHPRGHSQGMLWIL